MKFLICCTTLFALAAIGEAQDQTTVPATTSAVPDGRYEIVQSSITARDTFLLDRYCGRIWMIVKNDNQKMLWQEQQVIGRLPCTSSQKPRFQLVLSGIAARFNFLVDATNGTVWEHITIVDDSGKDTGEQIWRPMPKE